MAVLVQKFHIGQRVRVKGQIPFVIRVMSLGWDEVLRYGPNVGDDSFEGNRLTLCPEPPPYAPSERRVIGRVYQKGALYRPELYRCETDVELAARHAVERAEYDVMGADKRQVCDYPICTARGAGHPLACKCRTATPKAAP